MKSIYSLSFIFALSLPFSCLGSSCPEGWFDIVGHGCFRFDGPPSNWMDANRYCETQGSILAELRDYDTNESLKSILNAVSPGNDFWIGASDFGREGRWVWSYSLEFMTFNDWEPGQPDDGADSAEDCAEIRAATDYTWVDEICEEKNVPLCQQDELP